MVNLPDLTNPPTMQQPPYLPLLHCAFSFVHCLLGLENAVTGWSAHTAALCDSASDFPSGSADYGRHGQASGSLHKAGLKFHGRRADTAHPRPHTFGTRLHNRLQLYKHSALLSFSVHGQTQKKPTQFD
ncbi:hypothetical protein BaRGS_00012270 [Batillaria attramentaria]|uniref:Uncharacterized protein n=1 Tax=Batillaria attramentaria TaxID=370345 RepID=A0ABD0LBH9_9CAEN